MSKHAVTVKDKEKPFKTKTGSLKQRPPFKFTSFAAKLADTLCDPATDQANAKGVLKELSKSGIMHDDPRINQLTSKLTDDVFLKKSDLIPLIKNNSKMMKKIFTDDFSVKKFHLFREAIQQIYNKVKDNIEGDVASYIPQLAKADPKHWGVAICTTDGQRLCIGDTEVDFCIQSCNKIINYCIAYEQHGDIIHKYVGKEPSGQLFNALKLDIHGKPHNPCINAGAIMTCSLINNPIVSNKFKLTRVHGSSKSIITMDSDYDDDLDTDFGTDDFDTDTEIKADGSPIDLLNTNSNVNQSNNDNNDNNMEDDIVDTQSPSYDADRFEYLCNIYYKLCNAKVGFNNSVYLSERATGHRNYALGHFMKEQDPGFPNNIELQSILEFYFQCCSLEVTANKLSILAGTLANGGVNPLTNERIFNTNTIKNCLSIMDSCGMYDYSGEFAFSIGIPSKSGVGGGVISVVPGLMGIATFSPRLDKHGNSARGVQFLRLVGERFKFHHFDCFDARDLGNAKKTSLTYKNKSKKTKDKTAILTKIESQQLNMYRAILYASSGNLAALKRLYLKGLNFTTATDYDQRTPLHLAASNGHANVVKYLTTVSSWSNLSPRDRWNNTPLDDAKREGHSNIVKLLQPYSRFGLTILASNDTATPEPSDSELDHD